MQYIKPSLARGTRDFGPELMAKRKYIFDTIEKVFRLYGYQPLETPAMENLSTLTGKYGEEGDRLIFKILNSGDYLKEVGAQEFNEAKANQSRSFTSLVSEKALRYDLTVPLARYVSMNRHALTFPFKRYQIQPVWRADRPQKGRYREFYQCDVDVIGSASLFNEAELIAIYVTVFTQLGFTDFTVRINNRKLFAGLAEALGIGNHTQLFIEQLDKLDKTDKAVISEYLIALGADKYKLEQFFGLLSLTNAEKCRAAIALLSNNEQLQEGLLELAELWQFLAELGVEKHLHFDPTLARGLDYYTGTIMEVVTHEVAMGSLGGGGRYDNLTGIFGVDGLTGVGVSFGAERILDVLEQLKRFPAHIERSSSVLLYVFDQQQQAYATGLLKNLRANGVAAELFLEYGKMKKAFQYAEAKHIPYVALIGENESQSGMVILKNVQTGQQEAINAQNLSDHLK